MIRPPCASRRAFADRPTRQPHLAMLMGLLALGACTVGGPIPSERASTAHPAVATLPSAGLDRATAKATGPAHAPHAAPGIVPPPAPQGVRFEAADGSILPASRWVPEAGGQGGQGPVILAVHGYGDYGPSTFGAAAQFWAGEGIETYAYDQRGFGRGETRGRWPGAPALVDDLLGVAATLRTRHPCRPIVVVGHSMGGGVTLAAASAGLEADALVLAAPAIWGGAELNPFHRLAAWSAAAVVPERRFTGEGVVRIQPSDNIDALRALAADPFYLRPPSAREIFGLVRVTDLAEEGVERVTQPALLLLGEKDEIVPAASVERVFARTRGARDIRRYDTGWHLLFRDLGAVRVWQDVAAFALAARSAPGCAAAALTDPGAETAG